MDCVLFAERLKTLRMRKRLTMRELERRSGVFEACICKYENRTTFPSGVEMVEKLARGLHTDPAYLVGWRDEPWGGKTRNKEGNELTRKEASRKLYDIINSGIIIDDLVEALQEIERHICEDSFEKCHRAKDGYDYCEGCKFLEEERDDGTAEGADRPEDRTV